MVLAIFPFYNRKPICNLPIKSESWKKTCKFNGATTTTSLKVGEKGPDKLINLPAHVNLANAVYADAQMITDQIFLISYTITWLVVHL